MRFVPKRKDCFSVIPRSGHELIPFLFKVEAEHLNDFEPIGVRKVEGQYHQFIFVYEVEARSVVHAPSDVRALRFGNVAIIRNHSLKSAVRYADEILLGVIRSLLPYFRGLLTL